MVKVFRLTIGMAACLLVAALLGGCGGTGQTPAVGQLVGAITLATHVETVALGSETTTSSPSVRVGRLQSAPTGDEEDAEGLLVKFKPGVSTKALNAAARSLGVVREESPPLLGIKLWRLDRPHSIVEAVLQLRSRPDVEYAEPNRRIYPLSVPNDPEYASQWNLPRICLPSAWDVTKGDPAVVVAIIDTGVRVHPDLDPDPGTLYLPWDFVGDDPDPTDEGSASDSFSHGTQVAGIIGALTDNGLGVAGVSWRVRLMPLRVVGPAGTATEERVATAIRYAVQNGAQVINLSLGFRGTCGQTLGAALTYAHDRGVTLVAASGNENAGVDAPANHPDVISVGATNSLSLRAYYSNYGPKLDLVAPGGDGADRNRDGRPEGILSTSWDFKGGRADYASAIGTSVAAPQVAGVVALMIADGIRSPETIRTILRTTATDLGDAGRDDYYGYGLVNAQGALSVLARTKVLLAGASSIENTTLPNAAGAFTFRGVVAGTRYLAAWLDSNANGVLDTGDYYAESPSPVEVTAGHTTVLPTLTLSAVLGNPTVSGRFRPAVGLP